MGKSRQVAQLDYYTDETIEEYESIEEAAYDNFMSREHLAKILREYKGVFKKRELKFRFMEVN